MSKSVYQTLGLASMDLQQRVDQILQQSNQSNPLTLELKHQAMLLPPRDRKLALNRKNHIYHCVRYLAKHCGIDAKLAVTETLKNCDFSDGDFQLDFKAIAQSINQAKVK
jgi:hypothetical protein